MSLVQRYAVYFIIVSAYCVGKSINKPTSKTCDLGTVTNQLFELYSTTAKSINKLVKIGKKEFFPTFFPILSRRCWGYLNYNNNKSPFPTSSLTILKKFKGSKFNRQTYKVFLPFVLAMNDVLKNTNVPAQAPVNLMKDIDIKLTKVIVCLQKSEPTFQAYVPSVLYDTAIHKADVKTCLRKRKVIPTPKKIQLVQYGNLMDELYFACRQMQFVISDINSRQWQ